MSIFDNIRRRFASVGSDPKFEENEPLDYGYGVIRRIKLQNQFGNQFKKYEEHLGKPRMYMNVYLADPLVRSLIDLPAYML